MLYHENKDIPGFATIIADFAEMWDDANCSAFDKRSIYESMLLVVLRKVNAISDQEPLELVMLEMALVKFLNIWLQWGTATAKPTRCNKKISKKNCASMENHDF